MLILFQNAVKLKIWFNIGKVIAFLNMSGSNVIKQIFTVWGQVLCQELFFFGAHSLLEHNHSYSDFMFCYFLQLSTKMQAAYFGQFCLISLYIDQKSSKK